MSTGECPPLPAVPGTFSGVRVHVHSRGALPAKVIGPAQATLKSDGVVPVVHKYYRVEIADGAGAGAGGESVEGGAGGRETRQWTELVQYEVSILRSLRHPNVLPLLSAFVSGECIVLETPFMSGGAIPDALSGRYPLGLPEPAIAVIVRDLLQALSYLHHKSLVHRAVRGSHVLLSQDGAAKLSGLRYSCSLLENGCGMQTQRYDYPIHVAKNNLNWLSPEFLQQNLLGYDERMDIYSLGVTCCEAANGIVPFAGMPPTLMLLEKLRGATPKLLDAETLAGVQESNGSHLPATDSGVGASVGSCANISSSPIDFAAYRGRRFSTPFHAFVQSCCQLDSESRPSAQDLLDAPHAFLKQVKKNATLLSVSASLVQATWEGGVDAPAEEKRELDEELSDKITWTFEDEE